MVDGERVIIRSKPSLPVSCVGCSGAPPLKEVEIYQS